MPQHRRDSYGPNSSSARARALFSSSDESGFTLIELIVVMSIAGVILAIGSFGFTSWRAQAQHQGSAQQLVSELRATGERSISEGRTYCLQISSDARTYSVWQKQCGAAGTQKIGPLSTQSRDVTLTAAMTAAPSTTSPCPAGHSCLYFYPRGTAAAGTVTVASTTRFKLYVVHIEELTSRVWM